MTCWEKLRQPYRETYLVKLLAKRETDFLLLLRFFQHLLSATSKRYKSDYKSGKSPIISMPPSGVVVPVTGLTNTPRSPDLLREGTTTLLTADSEFPVEQIRQSLRRGALSIVGGARKVGKHVLQVTIAKLLFVSEELIPSTLPRLRNRADLLEINPMNVAGVTRLQIKFAERALAGPGDTSLCVDSDGNLLPISCREAEQCKLIISEAGLQNLISDRFKFEISAQGGKNTPKEQNFQRKVFEVMVGYILTTIFFLNMRNYTDFDLGLSDCLLSQMLVYDENLGGAVSVDINSAAEICDDYKNFNTTYQYLLSWVYMMSVILTTIKRFSHLKSLPAAFRAAKAGQDLSNTVVVKETLFLFLDGVLRVVFMFNFVNLYADNFVTFFVDLFLLMVVSDLLLEAAAKFVSTTEQIFLKEIDEFDEAFQEGGDAYLEEIFRPSAKRKGIVGLPLGLLNNVNQFGLVHAAYKNKNESRSSSSSTHVEDKRGRVGSLVGFYFTDLGRGESKWSDYIFIRTVEKLSSWVGAVDNQSATLNSFWKMNSKDEIDENRSGVGDGGGLLGGYYCCFDCLTSNKIKSSKHAPMIINPLLGGEDSKVGGEMRLETICEHCHVKNVETCRELKLSDEEMQKLKIANVKREKINILASELERMIKFDKDKPEHKEWLKAFRARRAREGRNKVWFFSRVPG